MNTRNYFLIASLNLEIWVLELSEDPEVAEGLRSGCGILKRWRSQEWDRQVEVDTATNQQCFIHLTVFELASVPGPSFDHDSHNTKKRSTCRTVLERLPSYRTRGTF